MISALRNGCTNKYFVSISLFMLFLTLYYHMFFITLALWYLNSWFFSQYPYIYVKCVRNYRFQFRCFLTIYTMSFPLIFLIIFKAAPEHNQNCTCFSESRASLQCGFISPSHFINLSINILSFFRIFLLDSRK